MQKWYSDFWANVDRSENIVEHQAIYTIGKCDEESDTASIMTYMPALIEEDIDHEEDSASSTENYIDPLTHIPGPTTDHREEPRYSQRQRRPTQRYGEAAHTAQRNGSGDPQTISEALNGLEGEEWRIAMTKEISSLQKNKTWTSVRRPSGARVMDTKFVFTKKYNSKGAVDRHKARLVVKGFQQGEVPDVYAPVVDFTNLRVLLASTLNQGGTVHHLDVKTAFLNGKLEEDEDIFVNLPPGLDLELEEGQVLKLNRALYGLKRAPRIWNRTWTEAVGKLGYQRLKPDDCIFVRKGNLGPTILLV